VLVICKYKHFNSTNNNALSPEEMQPQAKHVDLSLADEEMPSGGDSSNGSGSGSGSDSSRSDSSGSDRIQRTPSRSQRRRDRIKERHRAAHWKRILTLLAVVPFLLAVATLLAIMFDKGGGRSDSDAFENLVSESMEQAIQEDDDGDLVAGRDGVSTMATASMIGASYTVTKATSTLLSFDEVLHATTSTASGTGSKGSAAAEQGDIPTSPAITASLSEAISIAADEEVSSAIISTSQGTSSKATTTPSSSTKTASGADGSLHAWLVDWAAGHGDHVPVNTSSNNATASTSTAMPSAATLETSITLTLDISQALLALAETELPQN